MNAFELYTAAQQEADSIRKWMLGAAPEQYIGDASELVRAWAYECTPGLAEDLPATHVAWSIAMEVVIEADNRLHGEG